MTPLMIIGYRTAVENTRALAQSALPDAPVVDEPRRSPGRSRVGTALRSTARHAMSLADRIDPYLTTQTD